MSRRRRKLLLIVFALSALGATGAGAQVPGGGHHRGGNTNPSDASATHGAVGSATLTNRLRDEMDAFADELQLQPGQQAAFGVYRQRMLQFAGDIERAENGGIRVGAGAAPKQLEALSDVAHDRAIAVDDIVTAVNAFYPLLNPQQRQIADGKMAWMLSSLMEGDNPPPPSERALTPSPNAKTPQPPSGG